MSAILILLIFGVVSSVIWGWLFGVRQGVAFYVGHLIAVVFYIAMHGV